MKNFKINLFFGLFFLATASFAQAVKKDTVKTNQLDDFFMEYSKITFFEKNQAKLDKYKKMFAINNGYARTNISFAVNIGNAFSDISPSSQQSSVNSNDVKFDFTYLLTSFNVGIKHYFFNPRKRIGLTINYSIFNSLFNTFSEPS